MDDLARVLAPVQRQDPGSALPAQWWRGAFMQVFVRAYQDGNGDGIGDLPGLISRLDHLQALGVRGLWLMPVMPSADHDHGYATVDYRDIDPDYGTLADLDALLREAHRRGIGVILDYVVNHSALEHPLFQAASRAPDSPWRDWYLWEDSAPPGWDIHGHEPWIETPHGAYFSSFSASMPDFNLRREDVVAFHLDNLRFWLNRGVDGFRLDAVPHFIKNGPDDWKDQPESRRLVRRLADEVRRYERRYVVVESTAKPWIYSAPSVGGSAFAFGLNKLIVRASGGAIDAIREVADFFVNAPASMATMLSNHDRIAGQRLWDEVGGDAERCVLAAATYLLLPGTPFIYYGEEVGMSGAAADAGLPADERLRTPMSWAAPGAPGGFTAGTPFRAAAANAATQNLATQAGRPGGLLAAYRALLALRNAYPALSIGGYEDSFFQDHHLGFVRRHGEQRVLVLIHYGGGREVAQVAHLPEGCALEPLLRWGGAPHSAPRAVDGLHEVPMGPRSVAVFLVCGL